MVDCDKIGIPRTQSGILLLKKIVARVDRFFQLLGSDWFHEALRRLHAIHPRHHQVHHGNEPGTFSKRIKYSESVGAGVRRNARAPLHRRWRFECTRCRNQSW